MGFPAGTVISNLNYLGEIGGVRPEIGMEAQ